MKENLLGVFSGFPGEEHVEKICRPGQGEKTCCYLTMSSKGWICGKSSSLRRTIDQRIAEGSMKAKGDNCDGLVGLILEKNQNLKGKKARYQETMPAVQLDGELQGIELKDGILQINVEWIDAEEKFNPQLNTEDLSISIEEDCITFGIAGVGSFAGKTTIFL